LGEIVLHYEDRKRNYLTEPSLNLAVICSEDAFHFLISTADNVPLLARGITVDEVAPFYHAPLAYMPELMEFDETLFSDFTRTTIAVRGLPFRLVPASDYRPDRVHAMLSHVTMPGKLDHVRSEHISRIGHHLLTAYPQKLEEEIVQYFGNARIRHSMTCLLQTSEGADKVVMELAIAATSFELAVIEAAEVRFANAFAWHAESDILYYICAVMDDLNLSPIDLLIRAGGTDWTSFLQNYLKMHLNEVAFADYGQVSDAHIRNLVSVSRCGS
jgi:hypothetical protein